MDERPWDGPSHWYSYRCRSCNATDWVEDIGVDAFPPTGPGGCPTLECPTCGGDFVYDTTIPVKESYSRPGTPPGTANPATPSPPLADTEE